MGVRKTDIDGYRVGPFTVEEEVILRNAVSEYLGNLKGKEREEACRKLTEARSGAASDAVTIGRQVLPDRHPRSIYYYIRRRILPRKVGRWDAEEVYILLKHYFDHENVQTESNRRDWRPVSTAIKRLPEQVFDKWKELSPDIDFYRPLFSDPKLSKSDVINRIASTLHPRDGSHNASMSPKESQLREDHTMLFRIHVHEHIRDLIAQGVINSPVVHNVPWMMISQSFKGYSASYIRLQWTTVILPMALKEWMPEFSDLVIGRAAVYLLYKHKIFHERLRTVDFSNWFPQLPNLYVSSCVRLLLNDCVKRFKSGTFQNIDVYYNKALVNMELHKSKLNHYDIYSQNTATESLLELAQSNESLTSEVNVMSVPITLTQKRRLKMAYNEFKVKEYINSDVEVLSRIRCDWLPPLKNCSNDRK
ncbi:Myb-like DNA-binding domain family protein [Babesia bovis T2Bo]|uniref:Uncharacterized protein n=1 Tax=Babesia bovis TaxID=5865 RepID=A7AQD6_BABBO|nr:Myb-like DNA-binding domain family protein [Babesia bovis T2Bo]EDO06755.1 Myb-like DNA-binding domain family protein [Babesia bovis T2Bo]|eukprot:XP_001610323.1 hypothetical protein [Babesia bovis T2Bo]